MANTEHLNILKCGARFWNKWRHDNGIHRPDLSGTDLSGTNLVEINFMGVNLIGSNLSLVTLIGADLSGADLSGADLSRAILRGSILRGATLHEANFIETDLIEATLRGADLSEADFSRANFSRANLRGATLHGAAFTEANLGLADLRGADLSRVNFHGTNLSSANLCKSILKESIFSNSIFNKTIFGLTDLSTCKGLGTVKVSGDCVIDFQTLKNSKNLPKDFLFKMGLPETYIDYLPDFYDEKPLKLFPVFISHSSADKKFTGKLYDALIAKRVLVWYDEHKLKPGDDILDSIDKGINVYDKMVLVCSRNSLDSWWVEEELERIFEKERQYRTQSGKKHRLLIPVTIDDEILNSKAPLAKSIRKRSIGEFQDWQDEQKFNKALEDLIAALNADREDDSPGSFL